MIPLRVSESRVPTDLRLSSSTTELRLTFSRQTQTDLSRTTHAFDPAKSPSPHGRSLKQRLRPLRRRDRQLRVLPLPSFQAPASCRRARPCSRTWCLRVWRIFNRELRVALGIRFALASRTSAKIPSEFRDDAPLDNSSRCHPRALRVHTLSGQTSSSHRGPPDDPARC